MRYHTLITLCTLLVTTTAVPRLHAAATPPAGASGYWSFDQDDITGNAVADGSGNNADGMIIEGKLVGGKVNQAVAFDGNGGGATLNNLNVAGKQASVSLWIMRDTTDSVRRLLNFCTKPVTGNANTDRYLPKTTQIGFAGEEIFVHTGKEGKADYNQPLVSAGIIAGRWTHLVVTWDTAAATEHVKIYIDGRLRITASLDEARDVDIKIRAIYLGHINDPDANDQVFLGAVDELAVYDKVLSEAEIVAYFEAVNADHGAEAVIPFGAVIEFKSDAEKGPPYVPKELYAGERKLIRCASELCSRLLQSPSIAAADLTAKVKIWQETGLDGMIFSMATHSPAKPERGTNMTGQWWGLEKRSYEEFVPEVEAFQSVEDWGRLTDNFLWSSYAVWWDGPRTRVQNWFNDDNWEILLHNIGLHARVAKDCGFVGVLLDCEQYRGHHAAGAWHIPFSYPAYSEGSYKLDGETAPHPFNEVQAQVRYRGFQYARTVCANFPGARIMMIPGLYEWTARLGTGPLEDNHNGLYPSFLDGVLLGMDKESMLIGGSELSYSMTSYRRIAGIRQMFDESIALCEVPALRHKMSFAAGIWADAGNWSDIDVAVNSRSPEQHTQALQHAFMVSGEYAWLYGEKSFFLTPTPTDLMHTYFQANQNAHTFEGPPPP